METIAEYNFPVLGEVSLRRDDDERFYLIGKSDKHLIDANSAADFKNKFRNYLHKERDSFIEKADSLEVISKHLYYGGLKDLEKYQTLVNKSGEENK